MLRAWKWVAIVTAFGGLLSSEAFARPGGGHARGRSAPTIRRGPQGPSPAARGPQTRPAPGNVPNRLGPNQGPNGNRPGPPAGNQRPGRNLNHPTPSQQQLRNFLDRPSATTLQRAGSQNRPELNERGRQRFEQLGGIGRPDGQQPPRAAELQQQRQQIHRHLTQYWQDAPQPFSPAWYAEHPNAWQLTHPHADAWAVASWAAVAGWVGVHAAPASYQYNTYSTAVPTEDGDDATTTADASDATAEQAATLANTNTEADTDESEWLTLGVFAMVQGDQSQPSSMLQLAVSKKGLLRGSYYDLITNSAYAVEGAVDLETQQAAWKIADSASVVFETGLSNLTMDQAPLAVYVGSQPPQRWQLVRMQPTTPAANPEPDRAEAPSLGEPNR